MKQSQLKKMSLSQSGQTTFEYILMLSIAVTLAVLVIKTLIAPLAAFLSNKIGQIVQDNLFKKQNFHRMRIK